MLGKQAVAAPLPLPKPWPACSTGSLVMIFYWGYVLAIR